MAPVVTGVLAPALTISIGVLVAASSTAYPQVCGTVAATNGCQEKLFAIFAEHARIFAVGWLLLWALPWWRRLRPYRIAASAVVGAALIAAPLRLLTASSLSNLVSMRSWDEVIRDQARTATELSYLSTGFTVTALLAVGLPAAGALWFAIDRERQVQYVTDPNPPCQVHSNSSDVCPGG